MTQVTAGDWHVGAQNDVLYVIAGRAPALSNDYPDHEPRSDRVALARVYDNSEGVSEGAANARLFAASKEMLLEIQKQIVWLQAVKAHVRAPEAVMLGFDQSIKYLNAVVKKAAAP